MLSFCFQAASKRDRHHGGGHSFSGDDERW